MKNRRQSSLEWSQIAERELRKVLFSARKYPSLLKLRPQHSWEVGLQLVGGSKMSRLNQEFRKKRRPTDVLSFESTSFFSRQGYLGDLVVCLPVLKQQAREYGHSPERELRILLVHGFLHLLGFDHEKGPRKAAAMARWERKLLKGLDPGLIERDRSGI